MIPPLKFDIASFLVGLIVGILLVVLDKAGKLTSKPLLLGLLCVCGVLTLPLALGNSWVLSPTSLGWKLWRGGLLFCITLLGWSAILLWIALEAPSEMRNPEAAASPLCANPVHFQLGPPRPISDGVMSYYVTELIIDNPSGILPITDFNIHYRGDVGQISRSAK
jgi:hypothetical protein